MIKLNPSDKIFPFDLEPIRGMLGVYCFENKTNGMKYVGKSNILHRRLGGYTTEIRRISRNNKFGNALRKYSFSGFDLEVLEFYTIDQLNFFLCLDGLSKRDKSFKIGKFLCEREAYWIKALDTTNKTIGYNICARSNNTSGTVASEESKRRLSQRQMGEKNHFFGKKHNSNIKVRVEQFDISTGEIIKIWDSIYEIQKYFGLDKRGKDRFYSILRKKNKQYEGFGWRRHINS